MLFVLTRSNLLRQLPDGNGIILRLIEIVTVSNSNGTDFWKLLYRLLRALYLPSTLRRKDSFVFSRC